MSTTESCACGSASKLVFCCSGAADVGAIADLAARKLSRDGLAKYSCLAGIGGKVSGIVASTESAAKVLVIDACALHCARKTMEQSGFENFEHLCMADIGFVKGHSPMSAESVEKVAQAAAPLLAC